MAEHLPDKASSASSPYLPAYSAVASDSVPQWSPRPGSVQVLEGAHVIRHLSLSFTDLVYSYPLMVAQDVDPTECFIAWKQSMDYNLDGHTPMQMALEAQVASGPILHGSLKGGASSSLILPAQQLKCMLPTLHAICRDRLSTVLHVLTGTLSKDSYTFNCQDVSPLVPVSYTGFSMIGSSSVQEMYDMALVSHVISATTRMPILHYFDATLYNQVTGITRMDAMELKRIQETLESQIKDVQGYTVFDKVLDYLQPYFHRQYRPMEYVGHKEPETLVISLTSLVTPVLNAALVEHLEQCPNDKVGYLSIRLFRPWSAKHFLSCVPDSVKRIVILDQTTTCHLGALSMDIVSALYLSVRPVIPTVTQCRFDNVTPMGVTHAGVTQFIKSLSLDTPNTVIYPLVQQDQPSKKGLLNAVLISDSNDVVRPLVDALCTTTQAIKWNASHHLGDSNGPLAASLHHIWLDTMNSTPEVFHAAPPRIEVADYVAIDHPRLLPFVSLTEVAQGGTILLNTPMKSLNEMMESKCLDARIIQQWIQQKCVLLLVDIERVVQEFTLFLFNKEKETRVYRNVILEALFYEYGSKQSEGLNLLKRRIANMEMHKGVKAGATLIGAIHKALERVICMDLSSMDPVKTEEGDDAVLKKSVCTSAPIVQTALSVQPPDEDEEEEEIHVAPSHALAWTWLFPEAYQTDKRLRPDIPDAGLVTVSENRRLTPQEYDRNVFHLDFDLSNSNVSYQVGEALGVHGHNDPDRVRAFLKAKQLDPLAVIQMNRKQGLEWKKEYRTLEQVFTQLVDLFGKPGKKFYQLILEHVQEEQERRQLAHLLDNNEEFTKKVEELTPDYADVLLEWVPSCNVPLPLLLSWIPPIKPRHYSISSSMNMHPNSVHLLVVSVHWSNHKGIEKTGQCTRFLSQLKVGQKVAVTVRPSVMKLPLYHQQPIIMAGLGTGMAPFRAFIQERAYQRSKGVAVGPMYLYFGSRNRSNEYLYGEELDAYYREGLITRLGLAFSRDQPQKIYIQHRIKEDEDQLGDFMIGKGDYQTHADRLISLPPSQQGVFYLCGPTWPVPDVKQAWMRAFNGKGLQEEEASDFIEHLKEHDRYILEVY